MINFDYARASDVADVVRRIAADPTAKFIAGGTNLIDLMKEDVERPSRLIDITHLPLKSIEDTPRVWDRCISIHSGPIIAIGSKGLRGPVICGYIRPAYVRELLAFGFWPEQGFPRHPQGAHGSRPD